MESISKLSDFCADVYEKHPIASSVFIGGAILSVAAHSILGGARYYAK